jgi:hypothetical protein
MRSAPKLARAGWVSCWSRHGKSEKGNLIYLKHLALLIAGLGDDGRVAGLLLRRIGSPE